MKKTKNRRRKELSSTELEKGLGLMGLVFLMAFIIYHALQVDMISYRVLQIIEILMVMEISQNIFQ